MINVHSLLAAEFVQLVSFYKPLLILVVFVPWAWLISSKLEKDARYFHLNHRRWNGIYLGVGFVALAAMLLIPLTFWITWPIGIVILLGPLYAYKQVRNQAVPEAQRFALTGEGLSAKLHSRRQSRASEGALIQFIDHQGQKRDVPLKDDAQYLVHMVAEDLIGPALAARASEVRMEVGSNGAVVSQTVDGVRFKRDPVQVESGLRLIDYFKEMAGLNVEDRRRRQAGELGMVGAEGEVSLSITTQGSSSAQLLTLQFNLATKLRKPFDGLGLLRVQLEGLRTFEPAHNRHGVVLIGAPRGHGLTTSAYAFVARHDAYTSNIKTLEHEVQSRIDGVDHVQFDPSNPDVDYATNLQSMLRRDPDIVLTAQITDRETAAVVAEAGMQGPLMYIPQRAGSISEQVIAWVKLVGDLKTAAASLRAATNQRLLRTLCANCRQAYQPTAEQLQKMNLSTKKVSQLYRPGGKVQLKNKIENCPVCGGTGYLGQTGVFEVLIVDDEVKRYLTAGDLKGALSHARRNKMIYLQEAALSKVISGETSIEEVIRVTAPSRSN
ncbi:MAG: ATPase, T2SS/T4P/T4SS family, partial [Planctomycetota bacterium]|nr:ATPase, T2SS/T4P/T4SS family [Planctomycetota bacterium]